MPSRRPSFCSIHIFVPFKFNFRSFNMPDMILVLFYIAIPYLPPLILHISQFHPAARHILNIKYDFQTLPRRKKKDDFELNFMSQQLRPWLQLRLSPRLQRNQRLWFLASFLLHFGERNNKLPAIYTWTLRLHYVWLPWDTYMYVCIHTYIYMYMYVLCAIYITISLWLCHLCY